VSHIFTIDFTVTFTLPHTGWGCYVTNPGLRLGMLRNIPSRGWGRLGFVT
jgi:hypothetical protein